MGFKLSNVVKAVSPLALGASTLLDSLKSSSPTLPGASAPILYGDVPDLSADEKGYMAQREALLSQYKDRLNAGATGYDQSNDQIAAAENARYLQALQQQQGQLSVSQRQARDKEYQNLVEAAGRRGIRILGDDPSTATSDSTAGNQILSEFNKRYDSLADQQRLSDLQFGGSQNLNRLGLVNQNKQNYFNSNLNLGTAYGGLQDVYANQRNAQYNRTLANTDLQNQSLMNNYNTQYNQAVLNNQAENQTRSNRLGLINSIVGAGAMALSAGAGGGGAAGGAAASQRFGFRPYQPGGAQGPYSYGS